MFNNTSIAALATPPGNGGIAIVRISGTSAFDILKQIFRPLSKKKQIESHKLIYGKVYDGNEPLDECMAVYMKAPNSYTKEDVVEFQIHGGDYVVGRLLKMIYDLGAVPAEPGEFTKRAFINGRIDLTQAEAVMRIIASKGSQSAKAAMRQLEGGAFSFISSIKEDILKMLSAIEAALDYPEEIDEVMTSKELSQKAEEIYNKLRGACDDRSARYLEEGLEIAILGLANVGKSSLFNALMMEDRAIVTDIPGTTRDIVRGNVIIHGLKVHLHDTAGIRESDEVVEKIGIERALHVMKHADLILMVLDGSTPLSEEAVSLLKESENQPRIILQSKSDLSNELLHKDAILFSSKTGEGLKHVRDRIAAFAGNPCDSQLSLSRHMKLAELAAGALLRAKTLFDQNAALDLCAIDIHEALSYIGEITGENMTEQLLDTVFSSFCVGK